MELRQSTSVQITFGPFLDPSDANQVLAGLVSALDHVSTGIKIAKRGAGSAVRHATVTTTVYDADGFYRVTLDATDTDTTRILHVRFSLPGTTLVVYSDFMVLTQTAFDAKYL